MCGVVRTDGYIQLLNLNSTVGLAVFLAVAFKALGQIYEKSTEVLSERKYLMKDKWSKGFHRSCRPLKVLVAGMYFVDVPMSLTVGSFVIENVGNALILTK